AYAYAPATYAYVTPTYAYRPAYTVSATAVIAAQPVKSSTVYVAAKPATPSVAAQPRTLAVRTATPAQPANAAGSRVQPGGWVLDKNPYVFTPAPTPARPAAVVVRTTESVPVYVVSR